MIRVMTVMVGLPINILYASNPDGYDFGTEKKYPACPTCTESLSATQNEDFSSELLFLAPATPVEATFADEDANTEINLEPTTPSEATFDDDLEFISVSIFENLAPTTPSEADFDEENP